MPRFAILTHDHPFLHWDLLLEDGESCQTWRLMQQPAEGIAVLAERIAGHRLIYLDYEGPVTGDRGTVSRFDSGEFEWKHRAEGAVEVNLYGSRIHSGCTLGTDQEGRGLAWFHDPR